MTAPGTDDAETRNPFASARFTRWWLSSMVVGTGVGLQSVTVPLFVRDRVDLDVRATAIAAVLVATSVPAALFSLFGGAVADRVERRRILARTYSLAAAVSAVYVVLSGLDVRVIWPVFLIATIVGSANAFTGPARHSMLPELVSRAQLQNGVIFGTMAFMASLQFLGPTLAGLLVDARGLTTTFALEVVLLGLGAAMFAGIRTGAPPASGGGVLGDLAEGLRYASARPVIWGLLSLGAVVGVFFIGPFAVSVPIVVPDVFEASDKWVGLLWGSFGAGVFSGSVALSLRPIPRRGLAVCLSNLFGGVVLVLYGLCETLPLAVALLVVWGMVASVFMNYVMTLLQENTQPRMMGRVMSMHTLVFFLSMPAGYAQAGIVTDAFGPQVTLVSSGLAAAAIGLVSVTRLAQVRSLA